MSNRIYKLRFRAVNRDIFDTIKDGRKKIETRAATEKYSQIKPGDTVILVCGRQQVKKRVLKVEMFNSITAILKKYEPELINSRTHTNKEARDMWHSFPGYKEKIRKYGLVVMHLE